ncbi:hypothetical protein [Phenylobacterium sp.]|uniref:hypothetical protein n=1 Tax=Phenylobacterium sp. TaxID=1871053 RepID=UPI0035AF6C36
MIDRTLRRLTALEHSASTARVLNLVAAHRKTEDEEALAQAPFFQNRVLNRCIIVKHRVRLNEYELFGRVRANATKIMAPIDGRDLRLGARFLMIGQRDFDETAAEMFGEALRPGQPDRQVLDLIDDLPSLDPFLLREHLKRHGFTPARAYFAITDADIQRMYDFVRSEILALVSMSTGDAAGQSHAARLADKLLSNAPESGFEPLKETLKLSDKDYQDGVFAWRGFLYYKWVLHDLTPALGEVLVQLATLHPRGPRDPEATSYIPPARKRLQTAIGRAVAGVNAMLGVYDNAYRSLTHDGQPTAFRDFLLAAPDMFMKLGEQLGAVQHIVSFWRYRFPQERASAIPPDELMDIFLDFEDSLSFLRANAQAS